MQATIYNNMAACSKKELDSKSEIAYTSKVIDLQEHLTDKVLVMKAYLRRGAAYEDREKWLQAREDMMTVRELQFDNKTAQEAIRRLDKIIKEEYGNDLPKFEKNQPVKLAPA